jgi:hypothetical protein
MRDEFLSKEVSIMPTIRPINDRVVVKPAAKEEVTKKRKEQLLWPNNSSSMKRPVMS